MPESVKHKMTKATLRLLRGASAQERVLHRLHCVALVMAGYSASEVGRIFGDSPRAVSYWVKRFNASGITGLSEASRPGRPSKLSPKQLKKVEAFLTRTRDASNKVNATDLAGYILTEFKIVLTLRQCWRILNRSRMSAQ